MRESYLESFIDRTWTKTREFRRYINVKVIFVLTVQWYIFTVLSVKVFTLSLFKCVGAQLGVKMDWLIAEGVQNAQKHGRFA